MSIIVLDTKTSGLLLVASAADFQTSAVSNRIGGTQIKSEMIWY